jgi:MinD superfamily P-loop ATPase
MCLVRPSNYGVSQFRQRALPIARIKFDLDENFYKKIESFAKDKKIPIIGKIPYRKDFVESTIKMKPVVKINSEYKKIFKEIINEIIYNQK